MSRKKRRDPDGYSKRIISWAVAEGRAAHAPIRLGAVIAIGHQHLHATVSPTGTMTRMRYVTPTARGVRNPTDSELMAILAS